MYSALEGVDEVVDSFSQSFSPFRLPVEGQEEKPSAESGLETIAYKPTNDTNRQNKTDTRGHVRSMTANTDRFHRQDMHTHTHRCGRTRSDTVTQISKPLPVVSHNIKTVHTRSREARSAKQSKVSALSLRLLRETRSSTCGGNSRKHSGEAEQPAERGEQNNSLRAILQKTEEAEQQEH